MSNEIGERLVEVLKTPEESECQESFARAMELTGNPGISRHNPLERHYRDVLCSRIHSPQTDTILIAAGRAALGN